MSGPGNGLAYLTKAPNVGFGRRLCENAVLDLRVVM